MVNDNLLPWLGEVDWRWQGLRIATDEVSLEAQSRGTARTSATIQREGRAQVTYEVVRASGGVVSVAGMNRREYS